MVVARLYIAGAIWIWKDSKLLWLSLADLYVLKDRSHYRGAIGLTNQMQYGTASRVIFNLNVDVFAADSAFK